MRIDSLISQLLHHYDCVVVPRFGGFVTNYHPARFDKNGGRVFPPRKDIGFNRNLTGSDGLLEKALANEAGISFEDASDSIKREVESYWASLNQGEKLEFQKIGVLYIDPEKKIRFEPEQEHNYLLSSFGLESFELPEPIEVSTPEKETPVIQLDPEEEKEEIVQLSSGSRSIYWVAAAAILPFLAFSIYSGLSTNFKSPTELNAADLNPFRSKNLISPVYSERNEDDNSSTLTESDEGFPEDLKVFKYSFAETDSTMVWVDLRDAEEKRVVIQPKPYHIIAGCFGEEKNAIKFVKRLNSKGYEASILDYHKNLHRVQISSFGEYQIALEELRYLRNSGLFPNAWLLKKI